ncbi:transcriptional regulator, AraC family with amidase-like domain [Tistlia consotensis]|uniref:Transcriptional regulator, AraC family with amidase-like domain n=1 Tax=Tistlia consotensis USBA 355 TaxID=560819 RepID=A0A1Y6CVU5_9PROT|nr:GlxA family transcriptional regulator [Tistlia consotensis]SMF82569.1 transcriptional regulator, AraC family with amidase-like domain [Tistlia consotensis USBA 355]SNS29334.1 transcriptional regulator, AraC family with amidase-like domain [Tistlia consotensis]
MATAATPEQTAKRPRIGVLALPNFPMMAFSAFLEPFRAANPLGARPAYSWTIVGLRAGPVAASNGLTIEAACSPEDQPQFDRIAVVSGGDADRIAPQGAWSWLRREARRGAQVGAVADGAFFIARAGLLDGHRCSIHWESEASFRENFPAVALTAELFVVEPRRFTSAGGVSAFDMALEMIEQDHGLALATAVSDWFVHDRARRSIDRGTLSLRARTGLSDTLMLKAIGLMESHMEPPLRAEEIAGRLELSRDSFERRFRAATGEPPIRYYRSIRLRRARDLVRRTALKVSEIAFACGFADAGRFSQAYRERFGVAPSADRRRLDAPVVADAP